MITCEDISKLLRLYQFKNKRNFPLAKKINGVLHNKKVDRTICELSQLFTAQLEVVSNNKRNKYLVIVCLCLLLRGDEYRVVARALKDCGLEMNFYGGMRILASGKDSGFHVPYIIKNPFANEYQFIHYFYNNSDCCREYSDIYNALLILKEISYEKLENVLFMDKSNALLFLNYGSCEIELSNEFIQKLFISSDPLKNNYGLYYVVYKINSILKFKNDEDSNSELKAELKKIETYVMSLDKVKRVELLLNYVLFQNDIYIAIAVLLFDDSCISYLENAILKSKKVSSIRSLVAIGLAIGQCCKTINAKNLRLLYDALIKRIVQSAEENNTCMIFSNVKEQENFVKMCSYLSLNLRHKLQRALEKIQTKLMVSSFDKMVRYKIWLRDIEKWNACQQLIEIIKIYDL